MALAFINEADIVLMLSLIHISNPQRSRSSGRGRYHRAPADPSLSAPSRGLGLCGPKPADRSPPPHGLSHCCLLYTSQCLADDDSQSGRRNPEVTRGD